MGKNVFITRMAKFLPNKVVKNDEMEKRLGMIGGKPSRVRPIILRQNRIEKRYYSVDEDGSIKYSNAEMMALAIKQMFDDKFTAKDIELLTCGTSSADQILPSHTAMVHGLLEGALPIPIMSPSGVCCAGAHALQYAYLSVASGATSNAVCGASELISPLMLAKNFEGEYEKLQQIEKNPLIAFEKDFLRWMLSDGAGCMLLSNRPEGELSLKIEWIESVSFANELKACMYQGAEKDKNGDLVSWKTMSEQEWLSKSIFSIKQDVRQLGEFVVKKAVEHIKNSSEKHSLSFETDVNYFLPHISSMFFYNLLMEGMVNAGINCTQEKWFTNLTYVGNVGAASIYIMLEELFHSGKLKNGEKIYLFIPESGRFSYTTALLTVVK